MSDNFSLTTELSSHAILKPQISNLKFQNAERALRACRAEARPQSRFSLRKEVIQPQVLLQLPCYDFTPIMVHTLSAIFLAVRIAISSTNHFRDVTGGVYKARERIHHVVLIRDY